MYSLLLVLKKFVLVIKVCCDFYDENLYPNLNIVNENMNLMIKFTAGCTLR